MIEKPLLISLFHNYVKASKAQYSYVYFALHIDVRYEEYIKHPYP